MAREELKTAGTPTYNLMEIKEGDDAPSMFLTPMRFLQLLHHHYHGGPRVPASVLRQQYQPSNTQFGLSSKDDYNPLPAIPNTRVSFQYLAGEIGKPVVEMIKSGNQITSKTFIKSKISKLGLHLAAVHYSVDGGFLTLLEHDVRTRFVDDVAKIIEKEVKEGRATFENYNHLIFTALSAAIDDDEAGLNLRTHVENTDSKFAVDVGQRLTELMLKEIVESTTATSLKIGDGDGVDAPVAITRHVCEQLEKANPTTAFVKSRFPPVPELCAEQQPGVLAVLTSFKSDVADKAVRQTVMGAWSGSRYSLVEVIQNAGWSQKVAEALDADTEFQSLFEGEMEKWDPCDALYLIWLDKEKTKLQLVNVEESKQGSQVGLVQQAPSTPLRAVASLSQHAPGKTPSPPEEMPEWLLQKLPTPANATPSGRRRRSLVEICGSDPAVKYRPYQWKLVACMFSDNVSKTAPEPTCPPLCNYEGPVASKIMTPRAFKCWEDFLHKRRGSKPGQRSTSYCPSFGTSPFGLDYYNPATKEAGPPALPMNDLGCEFLANGIAQCLVRQATQEDKMKRVITNSSFHNKLITNNQWGFQVNATVLGACPSFCEWVDRLFRLRLIDFVAKVVVANLVAENENYEPRNIVLACLGPIFLEFIDTSDENFVPDVIEQVDAILLEELVRGAVELSKKKRCEQDFQTPTAGGGFLVENVIFTDDDFAELLSVAREEQDELSAARVLHFGKGGDEQTRKTFALNNAIAPKVRKAWKKELAQQAARVHVLTAWEKNTECLSEGALHDSLLNMDFEEGLAKYIVCDSECQSMFEAETKKFDVAGGAANLTWLAKQEDERQGSLSAFAREASEVSIPWSQHRQALREQASEYIDNRKIDLEHRKIDAQKDAMASKERLTLEECRSRERIAESQERTAAAQARKEQEEIHSKERVKNRELDREERMASQQHLVDMAKMQHQSGIGVGLTMAWQSPATVMPGQNPHVNSGPTLQSPSSGLPGNHLSATTSNSGLPLQPPSNWLPGSQQHANQGSSGTTLQPPFVGLTGPLTSQQPSAGTSLQPPSIGLPGHLTSQQPSPGMALRPPASAFGIGGTGFNTGPFGIAPTFAFNSGTFGSHQQNTIANTTTNPLPDVPASSSSFTFGQAATSGGNSGTRGSDDDTMEEE